MTELANLPFTWPSKGVDLAGDGEAHDGARAEVPRRRAYRPAHPLHGQAPPDRDLFQGADPRRWRISRARRSATRPSPTSSCSKRWAPLPLLIPPPEAQDALARASSKAPCSRTRPASPTISPSVAKYAIEPPLASATFALVMNPAKYNSLPADLKALIDKETGVAGAVSFGKAWEAQEKVARECEIKQGLQMHHAARRRHRQDEGRCAKPIVEKAIAGARQGRQAGARILRRHTRSRSPPRQAGPALPRNAQRRWSPPSASREHAMRARDQLAAFGGSAAAHPALAGGGRARRR